MPKCREIFSESLGRIKMEFPMKILSLIIFLTKSSKLLFINLIIATLRRNAAKFSVKVWDGFTFLVPRRSFKLAPTALVPLQRSRLRRSLPESSMRLIAAALTVKISK